LPGSIGKKARKEAAGRPPLYDAHATFSTKGTLRVLDDNEKRVSLG